MSGNITAFEADVNGSGDLEARGLAAARATLRMGGPGNAKLSGKVDELRADLDGSGELEADHLTVRNAFIDSSGPGDVTLDKVQDTRKPRCTARATCRLPSKASASR
ncbi:GIN domain-containing protein [Massilia sp. Dwa41.01b]|uniref:GIN domain-containing protein n=1 Tax=Massilia sp. Dwa41.01b TaxID=2709302 RepID=UPI0035A61348